MAMLVDCSHCRTPLQLPLGADCVRCALCQAITHIAPVNCFSHNQNHYLSPPPCYNHLYTPPPPLSPFIPAPSVVYGRKRAVICGVTYKNTVNELPGCINDAKCMRFLLVNKFKFPEESIFMLTEEETDPNRIPTKHNMRLAIYWLLQGCQPGESLVFHFSGHGGQQRNYTGDEIDGFDETLFPLDYETQGVIVDDEINETLVRPVPTGVKLHAIIDACHSGTALDLPYLCRMDRTGRYSWEDHRPRSGARKGTSGGEVISFSGCDDDQKSAESTLSTTALTGAMTFAFIQAIESSQGNATYGSILNSMRSTIRKGSRDTNIAVTTLLDMLLTGRSVIPGSTQEPQLTANEPFDVYAKPFSL